MNKKNFQISAAGLKNIVFSSNENNFRFIIGEQEIQMNQLFADFISPRVSHIHHSDPTINSICLNDFIQESKISEITKIIDSEIIDKFQIISKGIKIEIDEETSNKLKILSVFLGNQEMYNEIDKLYPSNTKEEANIDLILQFLQYLNINALPFPIFHDSFFDIISGHFTSIEETKLLKLPKSILYSIISNTHLTITSMDSLFDFITKIFKNDEIEEKSNLNLISFYELLNICDLSENKFKELIETIDPEEITLTLWSKLKNCFYYNFLKNRPNQTFSEPSKNEKKIEWDNNSNNRFKGIITSLGDGNPKSVVDKGIVEITGSSTFSSCYKPRNAVDYEGKSNTQFYTQDASNQWLCFNFKNRRVKPSFYSVRSHARQSNHYNVQNWCIEGSNDGKTWKTLDTRNNDKSLDGNDYSNIFKIQNDLAQNEFYQFLRFRQTGVNTSNNNILIITSLEFFGVIKEL